MRIGPRRKPLPPNFARVVPRGTPRHLADWRRLMAETDLSAWLTVDEALGRIGCSKRTVERLASARKIEQRLRRQDGTPPVAVYNPDDVARIASERRPDPAPFVLPAVGANGNGHHAQASGSHQLQSRPTGSIGVSAEDLIRQFFTLAVQAFQSPPSPPVAESVAETLYLTLPEASAFTGLTATFLRKMIKAGTLTAFKDRGWKIRRKDLEAL